LANFELLNFNQHQQLGLLADSRLPHFTSIIISEFADAASACPILLTKNPDTGDFFPGVVLSMKPEEDVIKSFAERGGFTPLSLQCQGFYISDQHIVIDRDHARFSNTEGDKLFTASQQPADCLRKVQQALGKLHAGQEPTTAFIKAMTENQLIEPVDLNFGFDNGERISLKSLYTISMDSLHQLDDARALEFFRSGYLQLAYLIAASLKQFNSLAHMRNQAISDTKKLSKT
jgi:hypothetical protein